MVATEGEEVRSAGVLITMEDHGTVGSQDDWVGTEDDFGGERVGGLLN